MDILACALLVLSALWATWAGSEHLKRYPSNPNPYLIESEDDES